MPNVRIKTADELGDSDVEARTADRRVARETPVLRAVCGSSPTLEAR